MGRRIPGDEGTDPLHLLQVDEPGVTAGIHEAFCEARTDARHEHPLGDGRAEGVDSGDALRRAAVRRLQRAHEGLETQLVAISASDEASRQLLTASMARVQAKLQELKVAMAREKVDILEAKIAALEAKLADKK